MWERRHPACLLRRLTFSFATVALRETAGRDACAPRDPSLQELLRFPHLSSRAKEILALIRIRRSSDGKNVYEAAQTVLQFGDCL